MISNYLFVKQVYYVYAFCILLLAHPTIYAATATLKFSNDREDVFHEAALTQRYYMEEKRAQSSRFTIDKSSAFNVHNKTEKNLTLNRTGAKLQNLVYAPIDTNIYLLLIGVIIYGYVLLRDEKRIKFK